MVFTRSISIAAILVAAGPAAAAQLQPGDPLHFFEGRTEDRGIMKVLFSKPYETGSIGTGRIEPDGSLTLIQSVANNGQPPHERLWRVRRTAPGHYIAAMSDAAGPVTIDQIGGSYRFRLTTKDHLSVEQWLTPLPGGMSARSSTTVRKLGITVATDQGMVRKLPAK
jgi:hypothetical protein